MASRNVSGVAWRSTDAGQDRARRRTRKVIEPPGTEKLKAEN
jgi:hypothetical protein